MLQKSFKILQLQVNSQPFVIEVNLFFFVVYSLFVLAMFLITFWVNENVELLILYQNQNKIDQKLEQIQKTLNLIILKK